MGASGEVAGKMRVPGSVSRLFRRARARGLAWRGLPPAYTFPCTVMLLRLAIGIVCLATCLPCQRGGEGGEEEGRIEEAARARMKQQQGREKGENVEGGDERTDDGAKLTPEQRLARNITNGASAHCRFLATVKP